MRRGIEVGTEFIFRRWHSTPARHFMSQVARLGFQQSS